MATNFPTSLDTFVNPAGTDNLATVNHASQHDNINDSVAALEAKVGINGSAVTTSLDYKVAHLSGLQPTPGILRSATTVATVAPESLESPIAVSSNLFQVVFFTSPLSFTTTQVRYLVTGNVASSAAASGIGLYSVSGTDAGTLIASVTGTGVFTATGAITQTWAASTSVTSGSRYALGFLQVPGSGTALILGAGANVSSTVQAEWGTLPRLNGFTSSVSTLPASFTAGSLSQTTGQIYAVLI